MLWRALKHIEKGNYIDIGAQDPLIDSVSLAFYELGWRGIHIEPTPHYAELLRQQRPGDSVIQAAVGNGPAVLRFFEIPDTGISTADPAIAQQHRERGFDVQETTVPCIALSAIFNTCPESDIHWLKIDVEGFEKQVLTSWGKSRARPWIVVVESTLPMTRIETHETWESILTGYGYSPIYFDGLNRFYISDSHPELKHAFNAPPNVFDGFTLNGTASTPLHHLIETRYTQQINEILAQTEQQKSSADNEIERLTLNLAALDKALNEHERSRMQREQEISTQLMTIQKQAAAENTELNQQHQKHLEDIQRQRAEHEWLTAERIHTLNQSLHHLQADNAVRERAHADIVNSLHKELASLLRIQAQREQEYAEQTRQIQQELKNLLHEQTQREQAVGAQLLAMQQQAHQEMSEQTKKHNEQTHTLQREHAEREQTLSQQFQSVQQELQHIEQVRTDAQHQFDMQLRAERETSQNLQQLFDNLQHEITTIRNGLSWRLTSPFRAVVGWFKPAPTQAPYESSSAEQQVFSPNPDADTATSDTQGHTSNIPVSETTNMPSVHSAPATPSCLTSPAPNLKTLLQYQDRQFIECAYLTLLKRQPDPEGFDYYLDRLLNGIPKIQILGQLIDSNEAREKRVEIPKLRNAVIYYKLSQLPLIGQIIKYFTRIEGNSVFESRVRAIEQQVSKLVRDTDNCRDYKEQNLVRLKKILEPQMKQIQNLSQQLNSITSDFHPSENLLDKIVAKPSLINEKNKPIFYYYVDHTVQCPANTGMQRTVRMLAKSLLARCKTIRFVKWNTEKGDFVLINSSELKHLAQWNGPNINLLDAELYSEDENSFNTIGFHEEHEGAWLLVPEVTHINFHGAPKTREILLSSKQHGLKSAFIFYDAIPLKREELAEIAQVHLDYMHHLKEADLILPISEWAKLDFIKHIKDQSSKLSNMRATLRTLPLPCESILAPRVKTPEKLIANTKNVILSVGSITPHKNQLTLVRAFNSYCRKNPDTSWTLNLVGHLHPTVSDELSQLIDLNDRVIFIPGASDDLLKESYNSCAFTIFPSLEEGFGLPIVESLWFGKPCICANFGAMQEVGSKYGCVLIDTRIESEIEQSIKLLIENEKYRKELYAHICKMELDTWDDYAAQLTFIMKDYHLNAPQHITSVKNVSNNDTNNTNKKKRIFWLGMHKILVRTELIRLRDLGYEVFNPKYLSNIVDQSAELDWNENQETTLPTEIFNTLACTNFFYASLDENIFSILNEYFDAVIVTIAPIWLESIIKGFRGKIIYRVYGQSHSITNEFINRNLRRYVEGNKDFIFMPHASEAVSAEENWFRENEFVVPYCLTDDVFGYQDSWDKSSAYGGEVAITCPNIANPFFGEHYKFLKKHYHKYFFRLYGVQTSTIDDPAVVGTLTRHELIDRWRKIACYIYTYDDPRVCYLPPIEIMVIGAPVLFVTGSLLDRYFDGINTPARFSSPQEALSLSERIRTGDNKLINEIILYQKTVRKRYTPAHVWSIFDRAIKTLI